jgi:hypothetical protein
MNDQHRVLAGEQFAQDPYSRCQSAEHQLNHAITHARVSEGFEPYLEIFDDFYADNVEVSMEGPPVRGKARAGSVLLNLLVPLHVLAAIGRLTVSIRHRVMPGDADRETNSSWRLDLIGRSGNTCTLSWRTFRKWDGAHVVYEHHHDMEHIGDPLTFADLNLDLSEHFTSPAKAS